MKRAAWLGMIVGLICTGIGTADAKPKIHDGFQLQLSSGVGYYTSSPSEGDYSGVTLGWGGLMMGGSIKPGITIGGGLFLDSAGSPDTPQPAITGQWVFGMGLYVDYYLKPTGGLHFMVFGGWGGLESSFNGNVGGSDPTGFIMSVGGGYDFWITNELSLGAMVRIAYGMFAIGENDYSTIAPALLGTLTWH